ncbi:hypothetical protein [Citricoccus muralis]|uniref:Uncharacterized protein n=1 Tax=Citricoccus muralis TaxID=169134 RepID=A0ABY8H519_9MICC|nr:hypothetical protein [Citricoccus muralis]WFP15748.1 hypothetical protein P8192_10110 [Citricoccus muralis]
MRNVRVADGTPQLELQSRVVAHIDVPELRSQLEGGPLLDHIETTEIGPIDGDRFQARDGFRAISTVVLGSKKLYRGSCVDAGNAPSSVG